MTVREGGRWAAVLRRFLLSLGLAVVAVCVVSMHQLSSDHALATADTAPHDHRGVAHVNSLQADRLPGEPLPDQGVDGPLPDQGGDEPLLGQGVDLVSAGLNHGTGMLTGSGAGASTQEGAGATTAVATWMPLADDAEGGCPSCASHVMLMASCLLALTLVVASWFLRSPTVRTLVWAPMRRTGLVPTGRVRIPPSLSLVELSLRRT